MNPFLISGLFFSILTHCPIFGGHYSLEKSWNGYLLDSVETVLKRAANFTWKAMQTTATLLPVIYKKGVKLCAKERKNLEERLQRSMDLLQYDILITPER